MPLEIETLIKNNIVNWKDILKDLKISITEDENYYLFKYSLTDHPDFTNKAVRECRGIILRKKDFKPVCIPFFKFGNYMEDYVPDIDWNSVRAEEKIDGSLIKVWWDNYWHISTNGTIDAFKANIEINDLLIQYCPYKTFGDLFKSIFDPDKHNLNTNYTYMFELVSPYTQVIIKYDKPDIYHIGTRDNISFEELNVDIGIKKPKIYAVSNNLESMKELANMFKQEKEGLVVVDKNWNRLKVKSEDYIKAHYFKNNGDINKNHLIELIKSNETEEFLTYCPEYTKAIQEISKKLDNIINIMETKKKEWLSNFKDKKTLALELQKKENSLIVPFIFANLKQDISAREYIASKPNKYICDLLDKFITNNE